MLTPLTRWHALQLALILLIAALLRFSFPTQVEYFHDEAMLSTLAQEMALEGRVPTTGILSSTGIPNPPTSVYVMALPFWVSPDPTVAVIYVMLLNVIGTGLLYGLVLRYGRPDLALLAGLFYAVNPWAIWFSRKIWAQDFHTPFVLLALLLLCYGLFEARPHRWAQALFIPVMLFAMQIHFAAWALLPVFALIVWAGRRRLSWQALVAGGVMGIAVMLPYFMGLAQTLNADPARLVNALSREGSIPNISFVAQSLISMAILASGQIDILTANTATLPDLSVIALGLPMLALTLLGAVYTARKAHPLRWALLAWAFGPSLLLIIPVTPIYGHYFVASLPALAILAGTGTLALVRGLPMIPPLVWRMSVIVLLTISALGWFTTLHTATTTPFAYPAFTTPLATLLEIREALGEAQDVVVVSNGLAWDLKHDVSVWETLLRGQVACVRTVKDGYNVWPSERYTVLITPDGAGSQTAIRHLAGMSATLITARQTENFILIEIPPQPTPDNYTRIDSVRFANGAQLMGYRMDTETLTLFWQIDRYARRGDDYQYTVQAYDSAGQPLGQADGRFWQGMNWCPGDTFSLTIGYTLPTAASELRVGLYQLGSRPDEYISADILDEAGNPSGQSAVIRLR